MTKNTRKIRLALPGRGVLEDKTQTFLEECGMKVVRTHERQYFGLIDGMPEIEVVFLRLGDIPDVVKSGRATLGFTGYDVLAEYQGFDDVAEQEQDESMTLLIQKLGYGGCKLVLAVPETWSDVNECADLLRVATSFRMQKNRKLRIATKFPSLTKNFWHRHALSPCDIITPHGALEATPLIDIADIIADLTVTGTTLRENSLKQLVDGTILHSEACLIANTNDLQSDEHALNLVTIILELIDARMNVRRFAQFTAFLPGESITHMTQATRARLEAVISNCRFHPVFHFKESNTLKGYTISGIVDMGNAPYERLQTIALLRNAGATDITLTPLMSRFGNESPSVERLCTRLKSLATRRNSVQELPMLQKL